MTKAKMIPWNSLSSFAFYADPVFFTTKVKNIKKYLLAALFNAPSTMNGYYQAEVNGNSEDRAEVLQDFENDKYTLIAVAD